MKTILAAVGLSVIASALTVFCKVSRPLKESPAKTMAAKLLIDPATLDLGSILPQQGVLWVNFAVKNFSDSPQKLRVISKSCGCLDVILPESLPPSGVGLIRMSIDARKKQGYQKVLAQIGLDKGDTVDCTIKYNALSPFLVAPDFMVADDVDGGETVT